MVRANHGKLCDLEIVKNVWEVVRDAAIALQLSKIVMNFMWTFCILEMSRFSEIMWPSCLPDLNPLDYWFCRKASTISEVKAIVEEVAATQSEETVRKACQNIRKRAQNCIESGGEHFEHML